MESNKWNDITNPYGIIWLSIRIAVMVGFVLLLVLLGACTTITTRAAPLVLTSGKAALWMDPNTPCEIKRFMTALSPQEQTEAYAAYYIEGGVRTDGCWRYLRQNVDGGTILGVEVILTDGSYGQIPIHQITKTSQESMDSAVKSSRKDGEL